MAVSVYQQGGYGTAPLFPDPILAPRDPTTSDTVSPTGQPYQVFQGWNNTLTDATFLYLGSGNWVTLAAVTGTVAQLTGDTGTALPTGGSIQIAGSTNITTSAAGSIVTVSLNSTLTGLTSITSGSFITSSATLGVTYSANTITATGSNADIDIGLVPKGTGVVAVTGGLTASTTIVATTSVTSASFITSSATLGTTYSANTITATGSDADISISAVPKGTGAFAVTGPITATTTITATLGNITATNGNLVLAGAGNKLVIAAAAPATDSVGTTSAMVAGVVTITSSAITAASKIIYSRRTLGTAMGNVSITAQAPGSAELTSDEATETSTFDYLIIN